MYRTGLGVEKDLNKAKEIFERGAARGDGMCKQLVDLLQNSGEEKT
jgi:TPR repeat protein